MGAEHTTTNLSRLNLAHVEATAGNFPAAYALLLEVLRTDRLQLANLLADATAWEGPMAVSRRFWRLELMLAVTRQIDSAATERECYEHVLTWKGMSSRVRWKSRERLLQQLDADGWDELARLRRAKARISDELFKTQHVEDPVAHEQRLTELRIERGRLERSLLGRIQLDHVLERESLDALEAAVPAGTALIDFLENTDNVSPTIGKSRPVKAGGQPTKQLLTAWIVRGDEELVRVELGEARVVGEAIQEYLGALELEHRGVVPATETDSDPLRDAGHRLRGLVWDPLAEHLEGVDRVVVSPHSFLGSLPLEVIPLEDDRFLLEERSIVYLQDLTSLPEALSPAKESDLLRGLLAVGGVDYSRRDSESPPGADPSPADLRGKVQSYWERLRFTGKEARTVSSLALDISEGSCEIQELIGAAATEEAIKRAMPGQGLIHVATHGFFQSDQMLSLWEGSRRRTPDELRLREETSRVTRLMPGLVCAGANLPDEEGRDNGLLTGEEVTWLDLSDCELVVLSACETGLGQSWAGEGLMSPRRAFRSAGARTVISSLWLVDDTSTSELMREFYVNLLQEGMGKSDALRQAQLEILRQNRLRFAGNPLVWTWGAFVLSGDWR